MTKDIILLGAGASKADAAPLQKEIFIEYINQLSKGNIPKRILKSISSVL